MNATLQRLKQTEAQASAEAEAECDRLAILVAADIAPTDPAEIRRILSEGGKAIEWLEQRVAVLTQRQRLFDQIESSAAAAKDAERLDGELQAVVAELRRVSEPLRQRATELEQARGEQQKKSNLAWDAGPKLASTAPAWIAAERRRCGQLVTAKREREAVVRGLFPKYQQMIEEDRLTVAKLKSLPGTVTAEERIGREAQSEAIEIRASQIARLESALVHNRQQLKAYRDEQAALVVDIERLSERNEKLDKLAMTSLWAMPEDLDA